MTVGERIKTIRKEQGMNQSDFGERIGVKYSTVGLWENGQRSVSDSSLLLICSKYNINMDWLKNGQGEMKIPDDKISLDDYAIENNLDDLDKTIIAKLLQMDKQKRDFMIKHIRDYLDMTNIEE